ncbi:MAG: trypsin-like peptidase domain-containing protein [Rubellimicrobium sp.]|nr:trypsin-like peptidase domain-containing protein [Rubellimicrobium sp.]
MTRLVALLSAVVVLALATLSAPRPALAQEWGGLWVQVEAQPTLTQAQERARAYAARLDDVAGFDLGNGWYAVALGPYLPADAEALLRQLRASREIPSDSYVTTGTTYGQQFWPVGSGLGRTARPLPDMSAAQGAQPDPAPEAETAEAETAPEPVPEPEAAAPEPALPDESRAEALASEANLTRAEREGLQIALQWAGFYAGAIDGAYGRGTRAAMEAWQRAAGREATGVLTTAERAMLLAAYNAVLEGLGLHPVRDDAAGIEMALPTGIVAFSRYEPPFALYDATDGSAARVILISQEGDSSRLAGLYEVMQTLEIVPPEGPRSRSDSEFTIEGMDAHIHSFTHAQAADGRIKGFTLVWPAGDEERLARLLAEMRASFSPLPGVLDPGIAPADDNQAIDLVSGLAIRQPQLNRSGFFIDARGSVLTTSEAVADCREITLAGGHPATVSLRDEALGIAVLTPQDRLAPAAVAAFQTAVPRLRSQVAVAGYPYGGALVQPVLTFGTLADIRGLDGEERLSRLTLTMREGDAGGPVFDNGGGVLGMLLPRGDGGGDGTGGGRVLPQDVAFALHADAIVAALRAAGIEPGLTDRIAFQSPEALTRQAAAVAVLVSCW